MREAVRQTRTAVQLIALIIGAAGTAVAAWLASDASDAWQLAIREEAKRSALVQEQVRQLYSAEAPVAFRIATARVTAAVLAQVGTSSRVVASERVVAEQSAFSLSQEQPAGTLAADSRYALPSGDFDVAHRLAEVLRATTLPDPASIVVEGDGDAAVALVVCLVSVLVTGAAVIAASVRIERPRHKGDAGPELLPQPGVASRDRRRLAFVLLAVWAAGVFLPLAQLALGIEEQRSQGEAARAAVRLTSDIAVSLARSGFATNIEQDAAIADMAATSRQIAALDAAGPDAVAESALVRAEESAASRVRVIAARMGAPPAAAPGIDPTVARALASGPDEWGIAGRAQADEAARAEFFGDLGKTAVVAIAGVAAIGTLVEVAASGRPPTPRGTGLIGEPGMWRPRLSPRQVSRSADPRPDCP